MLNGTLCATERALCCLVENYQTPEVCFELSFPRPDKSMLTYPLWSHRAYESQRYSSHTWVVRISYRSRRSYRSICNARNRHSPVVRFFVEWGSAHIDKFILRNCSLRQEMPIWHSILMSSTRCTVSSARPRYTLLLIPKLSPLFMRANVNTGLPIFQFVPPDPSFLILCLVTTT